MAPRLPLCLAVALLIAAAGTPVTQAQPASTCPPEALSMAEAVAQAVAANPERRRAQARVRAAEGRQEAVQGVFDPVLSLTASDVRSYGTSAASMAGPASDVVTRGYRMEARQAFPVGVTVRPFAELEHASANGAALGSEGTVGVGATVPLLRGRGREAEEAAMRRASHAVAAERWREAATLREVVRDVRAAFWRVQEAEATLAIAREMEARAERRVRDTRALVQADERPAADVLPVQAEVATRRSERMAAVQQRLEAHVRLSALLDTSADPLRPVCPTPFPTPPDADDPRDDAWDDASGISQENPLDRPIVAASEWDVRAAAVTRRAAKQAARPVLDVDVDAGYRGVVHDDAGIAIPGSTRPLDAGGPFATVRVRLDVPWANRAAAGRRAEAEAAWQEAQLARAALRRQVQRNVRTSRAREVRQADVLREAVRAERLYRQAVDNAEARFRLGSGTLFDVLFAEDRWAQARVRAVQARRAYAVARVQWAYDAGVEDEHFKFETEK